MAVSMPEVAGVLRRPRLEARLDAAARHRLTLLVAAAGYGKTTLLRSWSERVPAVWHTVAEADRAPGALARHVVDALRLRVPNLSADLLVAATRLRGLGTDDESRAEAYAAGLAESLDSVLPRGVVLILDDVQEISTVREASRFIAALARHAPSRLHLIVAGRDAPRFGTTRLLAHGEAVEIGAADLAFTLQETAQLLAAAHVRRSDGLAADLHAATAGWPVATRLALEAVASGDGFAELPGALEEPGGLLLDYMAEEVVGREPNAVLNLLSRAEPLVALDADLAAAIGVTDPRAAIAAALRRGIYFEPVPGRSGAMRLTPLFRSFVQARHALPEDERRAVIAAAARWHERVGQPSEALGYWTTLGDADSCIRLLRERGNELVASGRVRPVVDAAAVVPDDRRPTDVDSLAGEAWLLLGDWDQAMACYRRALAGQRKVPAALAWRIGLLHHLRGELDAAVAAYDGGNAADPDLAARALLLSWSAGARWLRGELERCRALASDALAAARSCGDHRALANAHTVAAMVAALDGDRAANDAHYLRALDHATSAGDLLQLVRIHTNRSSLHLEEGDVAESLAEADIALRLADLAGFALLRAIALSNRAQALLALGRLDESYAELEAARLLLERLGSPMAAYAYQTLGDIHRLRGDRAAARAAYSRAISLAEAVDDVQGTVPALSGLATLLAADEPGVASKLVLRALEAGPSLGRTGALIAAATVSLVAGDPAAAAAHAEEAVREAELRRDRPGLAEAREIIAAVAGDPAAARHAVELWRELGNPLGEARALLVLAELEPTGETVGRATAAAAQAATLGARELAARADGLLADLRHKDAPEVSISCLGGLRVARHGDPVPAGAWQSRKARDLLKLLVAKRGRPVHREQILDVLWPDDEPSRTGNRLSVALSTLRSVLDPEHARPPDYYLRVDGDAVALDLDHLDVDIERFLADATTGLRRAGRDPATAKVHLERAELAYTGDLFEDDPYPDWAVDLREEGRLAYLEVVRGLAELSAAAGDGAAQARYLLRLVERDQFDEQAHLDLVRLLVKAGRHGEARRRYRLYCRRMEEIEVEAAPYPSVRR